MTRMILQREGETLTADAAAIDLSIPLRFDGPQPGCFGAESASARPMHSGEFIGDTRLGGSCNADHVDFIPHCHVTHTECVGHITTERVAVNRLAAEAVCVAGLLSVLPVAASETDEQRRLRTQDDDRLITRELLDRAAADAEIGAPDALIVRTLPNGTDKTSRDWRAGDTPYFSIDAMQWVVGLGVRHLLVDTPSVDRLDNASLSAHRIFWGLPTGSRSVHEATRADMTITELCYIPDDVADGRYLLALQLAPLVSDATPSRPLLFPLAS